MSTISQDLVAARATIKTLTAEVEALKANGVNASAVTDLNTKIQALESTIAAHEKTISEQAATIAENNTNAEKLTVALDLEKKNVEAEKAKFRTAENQAQIIVAATGTPPVSLPAEGAKSRAELVAEYNAISDPQKKGEFWKQHLA